MKIADLRTSDNISILSHYYEWQVGVVTLDHYWKEVLKEKPIAFIKLDIEGHEYQVWISH